MIRAASPGSDRGGPGRCEGCYRVTDILVIRWKSIGDVVFALPAVNALRARFPEARITFLTSRENVFVPEGFRAVDRVWSIDRDALRGRRVLSGAWATARLLAATRREGFSLVVDLQGYGETAAFSWWSGAAQRWGYRTGFIRHRAYTTSMERPGSRHPALGHLELLTTRLGPQRASRRTPRRRSPPTPRRRSPPTQRHRPPCPSSHSPSRPPCPSRHGE